MSSRPTAGPYALLVAVFIVTVVLGQLIGNTATALIMIPIAGSAAARPIHPSRPDEPLRGLGSGVLDPDRHARQHDDHGSGGYRFGDYWKLGLVMVALFFVVSVGFVPLVWRF